MEERERERRNKRDIGEREGGVNERGGEWETSGMKENE